MLKTWEKLVYEVGLLLHTLVKHPATIILSYLSFNTSA